jgi:hypothetical protein
MMLALFIIALGLICVGVLTWIFQAEREAWWEGRRAARPDPKPDAPILPQVAKDSVADGPKRSKREK